ncbi:hypothetical protein GCM10010123_42760 [Pilimelia anulata]|uniref:Prepilin-type N-terminal cleavage/methylation domain-containing protein n=1 Tax=Pilimelia anulata TaxID=53371 RepID=A0A8J3BAS7_9ACTN|nr:hypothetical protein [Pilimelia anulata]GGK08262.1 hypothetical protein GCM10010123_42760 [Pilimelia anulata]
MRAALRAVRRAARGDAGVTLLEVLVASGIMLVVMVTVTTGIIQVSRASRVVETAADAQDSTRRAFARLDGEVRYVADIDEPVQRAGAYTVTMLLTNSAERRCLQVRLSGDRFERRTWPLGVPGGTWGLLVRGVGAPASGVPFQRYAADAAYQYQRLRVRLRAATSDSAPVRTTDATFAALNSATPATDRATSCTAEAP